MKVICENSNQPGQPWEYDSDTSLAPVMKAAFSAYGMKTFSGHTCVSVTLHWNDGTSTKVTPVGD